MGLPPSNTTKHVVAWFSYKEWTSIYKKLYSNDPKEQQSGVDRVLAWKTRVGSFTTGVEVTCTLVQSRLHDVNLHSRSTTESNSTTIFCGVQFSYAMAIIRFINFITDLKQGKVSARSLYDIAEEVGLPSWLIELRHESTHGRLPKLDMYRKAVEEALRFLETFYWKKQESAIRAFDLDLSCAPTHSIYGRCTDISILKIEMKGLMQKYIHHCLLINSRKRKSTLNFHKEKHVILEVVNQIDMNLKKCGPDILKSMVFDMKISLPTYRKLIGAKFNLNSLDVPVGFTRLWSPLLNAINQRALLCELITVLIEASNVTESDFTLWELSAILSFCLKSISKSRHPDDIGLFMVVNSDNTKTESTVFWKSMLTSLLINPNKFSIALLRQMLACYPGEVPSESMNTLSAAIEVYQNEDKAKQGSIELCGEIMTTKQFTSSSAETKSWELCEGVTDWGMYPIGMLPNQLKWEHPCFD